MEQTFIRSTLFSLILCTLAAQTKAADPSFTILDPSEVGATTMSVSDISGDGSTLVGSVSSGGSPEAYRWTASEGMVRLGLGTGGRYSVIALCSYIVQYPNLWNEINNLFFGKGMGGTAASPLRQLRHVDTQSLGRGFGGIIEIGGFILQRATRIVGYFHLNFHLIFAVTSLGFCILEFGFWI